MVRTGIRYGAILIGLYLLVAYGTGGGRLIDSAAAGSTRLVEAFQGRSRPR